MFQDGHWGCIRQLVMMWMFIPERTRMPASAPIGAQDCSHGWSAAKPVVMGRATSSVPEGRRKFGRGIPQRRFPLPLPGQVFADGNESTGSASGDSVTAPLHPWRHSAAPSGAENRNRSNDGIANFRITTNGRMHPAIGAVVPFGQCRTLAPQVFQHLRSKRSTFCTTTAIRGSISIP
jgi:hypothetical protein